MCGGDVGGQVVGWESVGGGEWGVGGVLGRVGGGGG